MDINQILKNNRFILLLASALLSSCVNSISDEKSNVQGPPFQEFKARIKSEPSANSVGGNSFEDGDAVGVLAFIRPSDMNGDRYINNVPFHYSSKTDEFVTNENVFFPEGDVSLDMISYYPYQEEDTKCTGSKMTVSVKESQNILSDYSLSDFLIAEKKDVKATDQLSFTYEHKFTKVLISLVLAEGADKSVWKDKTPTVFINGFKSEAVYDLIDHSFSSFTQPKVCKPYGQYKWNDTKRSWIGKEVVLIPQEVVSNEQNITIEMDGKVYFSKFPSSAKLQSGKQCEVEVVFQPFEEQLLSRLKGKIENWQGGECYTAEAGREVTCIDVSQLSFENSGVYKVTYQGRKVAEICKEYLLADQLASQAVVVYPVDINGKTDLSSGVAMELIGQTGDVHGGKVSWNTQSKSLIYAPGNQPVLKQFYITANQKISFSKEDQPLEVNISNEVIRDIRGGITQLYPLVKIGTQYWMGDNLRVSTYNDGKVIPEISVITEGSVGYAKSKNKNYYFYTMLVALNNKLLPTGWRLPSWEDWNLLKSYLRDNTSLLKSGKWIEFQGVPGIVMPANNLSEFNALPTGYSRESYGPIYEGQCASYWTLDQVGAGIAETNFYLESDLNESSAAKASSVKAFAIRCIRK